MEQTKPEILIDMLCQHPWYENNPRPTKEEFLRVKKLCGDPSMREMHMAITNLVVRSDEFPNPPLDTLRMIGFKKGICDIGPPRQKRERPGDRSYWQGAVLEDWEQARKWFNSLPSGNKRRLRQIIEDSVKIWYHQDHDDIFCKKSIGRCLLMQVFQNRDTRYQYENLTP